MPKTHPKPLKFDPRQRHHPTTVKPLTVTLLAQSSQKTGCPKHLMEGTFLGDQEIICHVKTNFLEGF